MRDAVRVRPFVMENDTFEGIGCVHDLACRSRETATCEGETGGEQDSDDISCFTAVA